MVVDRARRPPDAPHVAHAFAPAHWTGLFVPAPEARDPRARGSLGAGVVLELGVTAEARWRPAARRALSLVADGPGPLAISEEVARRLQAERGGALSVRLHHAVPIGQGLGTSAAGAVATGLAVARALGRRPAAAVAVAHLADLFGGGGLGGVAAILGGGLERRLRPGIPPWGAVRHRAFPAPMFVAVVGAPHPSPRWLASPRFLARVRAAGTAGLDRLGPAPSPAAFLREAQRFTDALRLPPASLHRTVAGLRRAGAWAGQTMFGRTVWAVPRNAAARARVVRLLAGTGARAVELRAGTRGAWTAEGPAAFPAESVLSRTRLARLP